jgi:hypothetical protein
LKLFRCNIHCRTASQHPRFADVRGHLLIWLWAENTAEAAEKAAEHLVLLPYEAESIEFGKARIGVAEEGNDGPGPFLHQIQMARDLGFGFAFFALLAEQQQSCSTAADWPQ